MSVLGIYFGSKLISLVESEGKKLLNSTDIPLTGVDSGSEEKVPEQIKLTMLISEELRKNSLEAKSADLVLPGKDMIIRTFYMPVLSPEELANAVRFEAKKYIPFKVEDLVSDFQIKLDKASRKNFVLFVGMKKENLDKYVGVLNQLNLKINSVDYAGFGILRLLKLARVKQNGVVALVNLDLSQEDEVNFVVLEDGFPLFSRDITLSGDLPLEGSRGLKPESPEYLEKLKIELRISLDFYLRKFPTKNIQNVIFIAPEEHRAELEGFIKERGLSARFVDCTKLFDKPVFFSSSFLKAYASSIGKVIKSPLTIDLLSTKKKAAASPALGGAFSSPLLSFIKIDFRAVLLGACILGLPYLAFNYLKQPVEKELRETISVRPKVISASPDEALETLQAIDSDFKANIQAVKKVVKDRFLLTSSLDAIPRLTPKGLWLTGMSFNNENNVYLLTITGSVYLGDSNAEIGTVDRFVSDLRNSPEFSRSFSKVSVESVNQGQSNDILLTNFRIVCRSL